MDPKLTLRKLVFSNGLAPFKDTNGKWGYKDINNKIIIPSIYLNVEPFSEQLACVSKKNSTNTYVKGFIDTSGDTVIPFKEENFSSRYSFTNGFCRFNNKFINKKGETPPHLEDFTPITDFCSIGIAIVKFNKQNLLINTNGEIINTKIGFGNKLIFSDNVFLVKNSSTHSGSYLYYEYVSVKEGFRKIFKHDEYSFERGSIFSNNCAIVRRKTYFEIINKNGIRKVKLPEYWSHFSYDSPSNDMILLSNFAEKKENYFNLNKGEYLFEEHLSSSNRYNSFQDGMALVSDHTGKDVGYYNLDGDLEIKRIYTYGNDFNEGVAAVILGDRYIYIDKKGDKIFSFKF